MWLCTKSAGYSNLAIRNPTVVSKHCSLECLRFRRDLLFLLAD